MRDTCVKVEVRRNVGKAVVVGPLSIALLTALFRSLVL